MLKRLAASSPILWKPKNPHSVEYLKYLNNVLVKNSTVTESNRMLLVETLRAIAEILIWGDQNDSAVFDFFLERQMLSHFLKIMEQRCGTYVCVQLLQTLNILFENIRHATSLYFLFSNNHINSIILNKFNFNNEEIMAYYISFLKTLSFRLNANTIHFFYNEINQEFPLYTEAIKFHDQSEPMVRIAVRTITLNIYKVQYIPMLAFVLSKSRHYFCSLIDIIAQNSVDIDQYARSAENESSNRDRLNDLINRYLDHVHYLNDIFLIKDGTISILLSEILFGHLIVPLYLSSFCSLRFCRSTVLLTPVSALFFISNLLLIVHESLVVDAVLSSIFFGSIHEITKQWSRGMSSSLSLESVQEYTAFDDSNVFFENYLMLLRCERDDHSTFYGILLLHAIFQNQATMKTVFDVCLGSSSVGQKSNIFPVLLYVIVGCSNHDSVFRSVTLELCCIVLRQFLLLLPAVDRENLSLICLEEIEASRREIVRALTRAVYMEEIFLELFEEEYYYFERRAFHINDLSSDPSLLLPTSNTPLSGVDSRKRLPSGTDERIRRWIHMLFHLRKLSFDIMDENDSRLPLVLKDCAEVELNDCINLDNSDLLSCTVVINKSERLQRFLVADQIQLILVEPDNKRLGWGIVRFVGLLQNSIITGDPSDSRSLHIVVNDVRCRSMQHNSGSILTARFIFDDHIRCMAAKQRLTKGRQKARQIKLDLICDLLEIPRKDTNSLYSRNPFRIVKGCAPGSLRKQVFSCGSAPSSSSASSQNVPDDPVHSVLKTKSILPCENWSKVVDL